MAKRRAICTVYVIDTGKDANGVPRIDPTTGAEVEPDVVVAVDTCMADLQEVQTRIMQSLANDGIITPDKKYHVHVVVMAPLPDFGASLVVPSPAEAKAILRPGEIVTNGGLKP